jgi:hypothetical protein
METKHEMEIPSMSVTTTPWVYCMEGESFDDVTRRALDALQEQGPQSVSPLDATRCDPPAAA